MYQRRAKKRNKNSATQRLTAFNCSLRPLKTSFEISNGSEAHMEWRVSACVNQCQSRPESVRMCVCRCVWACVSSVYAGGVSSRSQVDASRRQSQQRATIRQRTDANANAHTCAHARTLLSHTLSHLLASSLCVSLTLYCSAFLGFSRSYYCQHRLFCGNLSHVIFDADQCWYCRCCCLLLLSSLIATFYFSSIHFFRLMLVGNAWKRLKTT